MIYDGIMISTGGIVSCIPKTYAFKTVRTFHVTLYASNSAKFPTGEDTINYVTFVDVVNIIIIRLQAATKTVLPLLN